MTDIKNGAIFDFYLHPSLQDIHIKIDSTEFSRGEKSGKNMTIMFRFDDFNIQTIFFEKRSSKSLRKEKIID